MKAVTITQVKGGFVIVTGDGRKGPETQVCVDLDEALKIAFSTFVKEEKPKDDIPF